MRRLLIHSRGADRVQLAAALRSAANARDALGLGVVIHVVAQGPMVRFLADGSPLAGVVEDWLGIADSAVLACENSMESAGVLTTDLLTGVGTVPSAVTYLAEQQWAGWAYVAI